MDTILRVIIVCLFHTLVILTPLFFLFNTDELFEFNKMMLTYLITLCILAAWLLRMVLKKKLLFKRSPLDWPIWFFVSSQILSTLFSMHIRTSFLGYYTRFHGGLLSTLTYATLYHAFASTFSKKDSKSLFISIFSSSIIVSVYAILEHYGHSFSCWLLTDGKSFGVDCWIQDVMSRVFATFGQPNWLAAYCITLIPVGITLFATEKTIKTRVFYAISSALLLLTLLFTQSRSGMLGLGIGLVFLAIGITIGSWFAIAQRKSLGALWQLNHIKRLAIAGIVSIAIFLVWGPISIFNLIGIQSGSTTKTQPAAAPSSDQVPVVNRLDIGGTDSGEIRKIVWSGAYKVGMRYPLFGSGVETFAYSYYLDRPLSHNLVSEWDFLYNKAHNEFLNFFATTGVLGVGTYSLLLGWFIALVCQKILAKSTANGEVYDQTLAVAIAAGILALTVSNFFGFSTVVVSIFLFLWMGIFVITFESNQSNQAVVTTAKKQTKNTTQAPKNGIDGAETYLGITIIVVCFVILLSRLMTLWSADFAYTKGKNLFRVGRYQEGLYELTDAIKKSPKEALYYDEIAYDYAETAVMLANQGDATSAAELAQGAIDASDTAIALNSAHLNFYKTRSRMFIMLSQIDESFLSYALEASEAALKKAPTDAKLMYNLAIIQIARNKQDSAIDWLHKAIEAKPNYGAARIQLAEQLVMLKKFADAESEYRYILDNISPGDERALEGLKTLEKVEK